ncbi:TPA: pyridine nucleotide-disulfide oxidoreductase [Escherichia coli]|nr:pyridine nucleotide-disulfide oxidoreductase [Escherichia coli]
MNKYQAVIIGFGKAGKTLAVTLAKAGWRVALIEQSNAMYGGTCINIGCIPTKTLVHDAQQHTDFVRAIQRKNEVVNFLRNKNFHNLADMPNIDVIDGQAEFINNHSLRVHRPEGNLEIHGEKIFINTGAQTVVPPIPGITTTPGVYDSTGLLNLKELPGHLGILGGGYIGVEFASMFANFGSKVTILEAASLFLPREDRDIADNIATILRDQGVDIILNAHVERISHNENQVQVHSEHAQLAVDALLIASGRQPATASLHPENAGIAVNERGAIVVDKQLHTTADNIWAMGDVTGGLQFTYISLDDYRIVRDELLGEGRRSTDDRKNVPYSVFMTPPLSRVGMTEEQARESGADIQVVTLPVAAIPHARVMNDTRGVLKAIVDNKTQRILGASLLCVDSHEMINIVKMVMDAGLPYSILRDQIFTHPSMSESLNDLFSLVK